MFREAAIALGKLREARAMARMSREAFEAHRLEKFRRLVRHANQHSPFYQDIIRERGIDMDTCTPADFPVLTKSILMANFDRLVTDRRVTRQAVADFLTRSRDPNDLFLGEYRVMHTSGTSGEVGYFLYHSTDWSRGMFANGMRRRRSLAGRRRPRARGGKFRLAFYGATGGHFAGVTMFSAIARSPARLFVKTGIFEINSPLPQTIAGLNAFQPDVLSGYTAALRMLGDKQNEGLLKISPRAIAATGETVTKADMEALHAAFGADVTSAYGCTEHLGLGASEPGGETMRLNGSELIFEFREDHSLITNLFNYTMPLIRYRMSDILIPIDADPDPRNLRIKNLVGRTERVPTFQNAAGQSDFISPHTINEIFVKGVSRFQFRMTGPSAFRFLVILDAGLDAAARVTAIEGVNQRLREILEQKGLSNVTFTVDVVDEIPVNPQTRKFQLIVDDRLTASA
jgi:phenylacetate-coenzyme A ligase PaaK-like adenylate-forming protein